VVYETQKAVRRLVGQKYESEFAASELRKLDAEEQLILATRNTIRALPSVIDSTASRDAVYLAIFRALSIILTRIYFGPNQASIDAMNNAHFGLALTYNNEELKRSPRWNSDQSYMAVLNVAEALQTGNHKKDNALIEAFQEAWSAMVLSEGPGHQHVSDLLVSSFRSDLGVSDKTELLKTPLFVEATLPVGLSDDLAGTRSFLNSSEEWEFWRSLLFKVWDGEFRDWDLLKEVSEIQSRIWEDSAQAVAEEITKIRAKFTLIERIADLESDLRRATINRHGIGGNSPPEMIEDSPVAQELIFIWRPLQEIKDEISKDKPDPKRLNEIIEVLASSLKKGLVWCLGKGDLIVDTAIKWAVPAGGTSYLALNPEKLEAVIEAVKTLLRVL